MKILHVVGARPNFMKVAPLIRALDARGVQSHLLHTGQHYDEKMSKVFFEDLGLPRPDTYLGVGSGTHSEQTARVMLAFEPVITEVRPDLVVVVGDVNSTVACALVAAKAGIAVAHVEAGLRSRDWTMPEEINRVVTDRLADLLLTPSPDADDNLRAEGVEESRIHRVGNVMIDSLVANLERAADSTVLQDHGLERDTYAVLTLHRPANVDELAMLQQILAAVCDVGRSLPVLFSCHPRTRKQIEAHPDLEALLQKDGADVRLLDPLGYHDFLRLTSQSRLVMTDSGGLQEETTYLKIPCLTIRENTERPITITEGTNDLVGRDPDRIREGARRALAQAPEARVNQPVPDLWEGRAADRIADVFEAWDAGRGS